MSEHDARCCHCDGFCRPAVQCSACAMTREVMDAAGRDLVREVESVLRFRASVSITTRREP